MEPGGAAPASPAPAPTRWAPVRQSTRHRSGPRPRHPCRAWRSSRPSTLPALKPAPHTHRRRRLPDTKPEWSHRSSPHQRAHSYAIPPQARVRLKGPHLSCQELQGPHPYPFRSQRLIFLRSRRNIPLPQNITWHRGETFNRLIFRPLPESISPDALGCACRPHPHSLEFLVSFADFFLSFADFSSSSGRQNH